jgi:hypothetical protein
VKPKEEQMNPIPNDKLWQIFLNALAAGRKTEAMKATEAMARNIVQPRNQR